MYNLQFFLNGILLGVGLGMDAFSVSIANGINQKRKGLKEAVFIATVFAFCQGLMPFIGWAMVKSAVKRFEFLSKIVPWIAFFLLVFLGIKTIKDGFKEKENKTLSLSFFTILLQGIATSIDAFSVGFTISNLNMISALITSLLISIVTFCMCFTGVVLGKALSKEFSLCANLLGGALLIFVALEVLVKLLFFS